MTTSVRGRPVDPSAAADIVVGVISDTHGSLYPQVKECLQGVDHIVHAGDIGSPQVLAELEAIAPLTAVRGNCDLDVWARSLPVRAQVELGGVGILVEHVAGPLRRAQPPRGDPEGRLDPEEIRTGEPGIVVSGHSHVAAVEERDGVLYLNPGSAGPRRFLRPRTLARLVIHPLSSSTAPDSAWGLPHVDVDIVTLNDR